MNDRKLVSRMILCQDEAPGVTKGYCIYGAVSDPTDAMFEKDYSFEGDPSFECGEFKEIPEIEIKLTTVKDALKVVNDQGVEIALVDIMTNPVRPIVAVRKKA